MEKLYSKEIADAVSGELTGDSPDACSTGIATDTRSLQPGDLFFALKGENCDGHQFVARAIEAGASGVVVSDLDAVPAGTGAFIVRVDDPVWALGDLAGYYRNKFDVRVVGVTGSVGKTTTKEMLSSILERKWKVLRNEANFNNEIGLPLTLFKLDRTHDIAVLEMGMRGLGEIRRLAEIARPSVGIITNIGISHIERLGSQSAIAEAKGELLTELPRDGIAVMNAEDGYFMVMRHRFPGRIVSFGSCQGADVVGARIKSGNTGCRFAVTVEGAGSIDVNMPVLGVHNVYNALAASAAAHALGMDLRAIRDGLENVPPSSMRMELVTTKSGITILNDAYNASPASMLAALKTLNNLCARNRRIAVLGDMLELGDFGPKSHKDIGVALATSDVDMIVTVGPLARMIAEGAVETGFPADMVGTFDDSTEAAQALKAEVVKGDVLLVKGSRSMRMEEIVRVLIDG